MHAVIQNIPYEVRFRHTRLPGHDKRVKPTFNDAFELLAVVANELADPGSLKLKERIGMDLKGAVAEFINDYISASITKSHSTDCYILDADRSKPFEKRLVSSGQTFCDKMDNFDRAEGRWHAFNKAIDAFPEAAQLDWLEWFVDSPMRKPYLIAQCAPQPCTRAVPGWRCIRGFHEDGPCAAVPDDGCVSTTKTIRGALTVTETAMPPALLKTIADNLAIGKAAR